MDFAGKIRELSIGLGYRGVSSGGIEKTSYSSELARYVKTGESMNFIGNAVLVSLAHPVYENEGLKLSSGVNFKWMKESFGGTYGTGVNWDVGIFGSWNQINLGASLRNIDQSSKVQWTTGTVYKMDPELATGVSMSMLDETLNSSVQLTFKRTGKTMSPKMGLGLEYELSKMMPIRVGYYNDAMTAGIGMFLGGLKLDYAIEIPKKEYREFMEMTHKVGFGYDIENKSKAIVSQSKPVEKPEIMRWQGLNRVQWELLDEPDTDEVDYYDYNDEY